MRRTYEVILNLSLLFACAGGNCRSVGKGLLASFTRTKALIISCDAAW